MASPSYACPNCLSSLDQSADNYRCSRCAGSFPIERGVPQFVDWRQVLDESDDLIASWHLTQQASMALYEENSTDSCADAARFDVQQVREFLNFDGEHVLDVGSGAFVRPGYISDDVGRYVGIDPIQPSEPPAFELLNAFAEQLPFPDAHFDAVLFATSLDHVLHVPSALAEADRVLKPGGHVYFWGGLAERDSSYREVAIDTVLSRTRQSFEMTSTEAHEQLKKRLQGFEQRASSFDHLLVDDFHVRHFAVADVVRLFAAAGFAPRRSQQIVQNHDVSSVILDFSRAEPSMMGAAAIEVAATTQHSLTRSVAQAEFAELQRHNAVVEQVSVLRNEVAESEHLLAGRVETVEQHLEGARAVGEASNAELRDRVEVLERRLEGLESSGGLQAVAAKARRFWANRVRG